MDGLCLSLMHRSIIRQPGSPQERDALLRIDTPAPWQRGSRPGGGATHAGRCLLLIFSARGEGDHGGALGSFNTSHFVLHYSEVLGINHAKCV